MLATHVGREAANPAYDRGEWPWSGANVLVTGARGFVGRRLTRRLAARGARVTRLANVPRGDANGLPHTSRATAPVVTASVTDLSTLAEIIEARKISAVFHLAAMNANRGTDISLYSLFETNIRGTYTLLEACHTATTPPRVVVVSSREAEQCFDPHRKQALHPYAASKAAAELVAASVFETFGLKGVTLRTGSIYGGGDLNWNRLIPSAIRSLLAGKRPALSGSLQERRDYIHVDDVVAACLAAVEHADHLREENRTMRISTGVQTSTLTMLQKIAVQTGQCDLVPEIVGRSNQETPDDRVPCLHEVAALGWGSKISLDQGLVMTIDWYRRFLRRINGV